MLVLPLGLGTRWPRLPIVTLAISVVLIVFFLFEKGHIRTSERSYHFMSDRFYRAAKEKLFLEYCLVHKEKPLTCADVKTMIAPDYEALLAQEKKPKSKKTPQDNGPEVELPLEVEQHYDLVSSRFEQELAKPSPEFLRLKSYAYYRRAELSYKRKTLDVYRKESILSRENIRADSLLMAQVRHGGFNHLIGNLLCFIAFGIYVEQRMGALRFLLAYVITGSVGLLINSLYFLPADLPLLGASANISGIMGLFYMFFFHSRMRFLLWFGLSRRLWAPVKIAFPLVFVVSDLAGAMQSLVPSGGAGSVAHFAHLGGLLSGMAIAWVVQRISPVPGPFIYGSEVAQYQQLRSDPSLDGKISRAEEILGYNLDNGLVRGAVLEAILSRRAALQSELPNAAHRFVLNHLDNQCMEAMRLGKLEVATKLVQAVPLHLPLHEYLGTLGQTHHLILADAAVAQGQNYLAIRLYDSFLLRWKNTHKEASIRRSVEAVLRALPNDSRSAKGLQTYLYATPDSCFIREFSLHIASSNQPSERMRAVGKTGSWPSEQSVEGVGAMGSRVMHDSEQVG